MADRIRPIDRRELMRGFGAAAVAATLPPMPALATQTRVLRAGPRTISLRPGGPDTAIWSLDGPDLRFRRGDFQEIQFGNDLPVATALNWRGIDGASAAEPLAARRPLATGAKDSFAIPLRQAGTFFCDPGLLGDGQDRPSR